MTQTNTLVRFSLLSISRIAVSKVNESFDYFRGKGRQVIGSSFIDPANSYLVFSYIYIFYLNVYPSSLSKLRIYISNGNILNYNNEITRLIFEISNFMNRT